MQLCARRSITGNNLVILMPLYCCNSFKQWVQIQVASMHNYFMIATHLGLRWNAGGRGGEGLHSTEVVFLLLTQRTCVDVAEIYQQRLEESGQRLETVDQTRLVLATGKLVLQITMEWLSMQ